MKKIKIVLLLGFVGLFAASCGETSTDETMTADSLTTVPAADNTAGGITVAVRPIQSLPLFPILLLVILAGSHGKEKPAYAGFNVSRCLRISQDSVQTVPLRRGRAEQPLNY